MTGKGITRVVVAGALGRMGRLLVDAVLADPALALVGATVRRGSPEAGKDAAIFAGRASCGVGLVDDLQIALAGATARGGANTTGRIVVVDFTTPGTTGWNARLCAGKDVAYVVGTTGLTREDHAALDEAAKRVPVLVASNTSLGANLLFSLAATTAQAMPHADVEVVELHHRRKKDAPSGTALTLATAVAVARGQTPSEAMVHARAGEAPRKPGDIGVLGVRGGDVVGEHTIYFMVDGERIELTHRVSDRRIFATGALVAAAALSTREPGRYAMADVLGLGA